MNNLVLKLDEYGPSEVDAATRMEILTKIRDCAANHYFRAWLENPTAMDITREWLKAPLTSDDQELVGTVMPLLHVRRARSVLDDCKPHLIFVDSRSVSDNTRDPQGHQAR